MAKDEQLVNSKSQDNFTTEKINVISNCLFGNYVGDEYVISDEIKEELLKDKKVKKSVYKNSVFCSAYIVGYGDVVFEATFQKNTVKNVAMAELFVLENEYKVNGYIQNTIRTKVAEFISDLDNFIEKTYEYFNIVITDDDRGKKYNLHEDISLNAYINAKKNFNLSMEKLTAKDYNKLYKKYVTARLEKLKKRNNNFSNDVLNKFNGEFAKIEKYFLRDNNYKAVSELLDKCIEDCAGVNPNFKQDEREVMDDLTPIIEDFSREADSVYEKAHPKALNSLNKTDKNRMEDLERELHEQERKTQELERKMGDKAKEQTPTKSGNVSAPTSSGSTTYSSPNTRTSTSFPQPSTSIYTSETVRPTIPARPESVSPEVVVNSSATAGDRIKAPNSALGSGDRNPMPPVETTYMEKSATHPITKPEEPNKTSSTAGNEAKVPSSELLRGKVKRDAFDKSTEYTSGLGRGLGWD